MAAVVDQRGQHAAVVGADAGDQDRVVGFAVGVEAGDELLRVLVPGVAVLGQVAGAGAEGEPRGHEVGNRLGAGLRATADQLLEIGADLVAAGVVAHGARQVRAGVGMGEGDEQTALVEAEWFAHPVQELAHLVLLEPTDVDGKQEHRTAVAFQLVQGQGGGGEGPVDAFGGLVQGGAEGAALNADGGCHVPAGRRRRGSGRRADGTDAVSS